VRGLGSETPSARGHGNRSALQRRGSDCMDRAQPRANASTKPGPRRSSAYMSIMNVTAAAPKAVSTLLVWRVTRHYSRAPGRLGRAVFQVAAADDS
jgi:hypothetical protein